MVFFSRFFLFTIFFSHFGFEKSEKFQTNNVQLNLKVGAIKANLLRMTSQYNVCNSKLTRTISDLDEMTAKCDQLQLDLIHQQNVAKHREAELIRLARENAQMMKIRDTIQKRIQTLEAEKMDLTKEVTKLRFGNIVSCTNKMLP